MIMPITLEGKKKLEAELHVLKEEFARMPKIIGEARAKGDLKENAEYHAAKERQGMLNAQIQKLNYELVHSKVINILELPKDKVTFGKKVSLLDLDTKEVVTYILLGASESNMKENKISIGSLIAKGLLTKQVGDEANISVPSGLKRYRITKIEPFC